MHHFEGEVVHFKTLSAKARGITCMLKAVISTPKKNVSFWKTQILLSLKDSVLSRSR